MHSEMRVEGKIFFLQGYDLEKEKGCAGDGWTVETMRDDHKL